MNDYFRHCSTCKTPIQYGADYYKCSVSTCNHSRLGLFFCSVECWDAHVPGARHRDAWAEKERAPTREAAEAREAREAAAAAPTATAPVRRMVSTAAPVAATVDDGAAGDGDEVLVVVSKLKKYIKERAGMNTSTDVVGPLSDHLRRVSDAAVAVAQKDGRKTVLERDFVEAIRRFGRA